MASKTDRRRNGIIDKLPALLRESVDQMLLAGITYREIVEYLRQKDIILSRQAVCNYARKFLATTQMMRIAENNFRVFTEAIENSPELDTAEGLIRVMSNHLLNTLTNMSAEDLEKVDPAKLLRETNALVRVTAFKRRVDTQNRGDVDNAPEGQKELLYDALYSHYPELYTQIIDALTELRNKEQ